MGSFCIAKGAQPSALWWPRRVGGKLKREGICTHLWLIHAVVGQKPTQHCKAIILQLEVDFLKSPSAFVFSFFSLYFSWIKIYPHMDASKPLWLLAPVCLFCLNSLSRRRPCLPPLRSPRLGTHTLCMPGLPTYLSSTSYLVSVSVPSSLERTLFTSESSPFSFLWTLLSDHGPPPAILMYKVITNLNTQWAPWRKNDVGFSFLCLFRDWPHFWGRTEAKQTFVEWVSDWIDY